MEQEMDYEQARFNMIEQQVRTWEVLDKRVLEALSLIHREDFVPSEYKQLALSDVNIPLAHGQITMQPRVEARLVQALGVNSDDKVLEIGTGCAYLTAILARFSRQVISIDIFDDFTAGAREKLDKCNITNTSVITADAINGHPDEAPYDVIAVTGSLPEGNRTIEEQLTIGGRMFVIIGESPVMEATLVTRVDKSQWNRETLFETDLPALIGAVKPSRFAF